MISNHLFVYLLTRLQKLHIKKKRDLIEYHRSLTTGSVPVVVMIVGQNVNMLQFDVNKVVKLLILFYNFILYICMV